MRSGEIKALTGLRIVAALWVVLFHFRPLLWQAAPDFASALAPILDCGAQGVDLFFILSGFVLTWNYLDKMGKSWSTRATLRFLWLRLARVWPVYLVTMHLAALWIIFTLNVGHVPSETVSTLNAISYIRQLLLVQLWFQPFFDGSSWDGPAWSISAEWLAYLVFGLLILVVFRIARATRARSLLWLAVRRVAASRCCCCWRPVTSTRRGVGCRASSCSSPRARWPVPRSASCARATGPGPARATSSLLLVAAIVGALYLLAAHPVPTVFDGSGLVDVLFVPLVITLAIGTGTLPALLSTCGRWCTSADLVQPVHGPRVGAHHLDLDGASSSSWFWRPTLAGKLTSSACSRSRSLGAVLLYHVVEEPARRWMRRMVDVSDASLESANRTRDGQAADRSTARAG